MKFITRFLCVPVAGLLALTSCAKDEDESYVQFENQALEAWMTQHRPDLVKNYQPDGGYYIDVLDAGEPDKDPLNKEPIWVSFDFTGRDLAGNIILTRSASDAKLTGAFSKYTHYVPFYRYCGTENTGLMEGTWLAMRNTLKLDQEYFDKYKNDPDEYPERENANRFGDAAYCLGVLYYITGKEVYAKACANHLRTWFTDPKLGMNPNMTYAQAVPGMKQMRGSGFMVLVCPMSYYSYQ